MTTTPAQRAKALLEKFGPVSRPLVGNNGFWHGETTVGDLALHVSAPSTEAVALEVDIYDWGDVNQASILSLSQVRDDDLVEAIIRQVLDHHHGRQVI